jgi:predicted XRE-type DNA-binding protein
MSMPTNPAPASTSGRKAPQQDALKSIFDDRELFDPDEAANLKVRSQLMNRLVAYVKEHGLSQFEAADAFGTSQPRISNLMKGSISKFSIDALLNMCTASGIEVEVRFLKTTA